VRRGAGDRALAPAAAGEEGRLLRVGTDVVVGGGVEKRAAAEPPGRERGDARAAVTPLAVPAIVHD
jgi:hypothetical protein